MNGPLGESPLSSEPSQDEPSHDEPSHDEPSQETGYGPRKLVGVFGLMVVLLAAGYVFGGEWGNIAWSAVEVFPFALLATFTYLGVDRSWSKVVSLLVLALIILGAGLVTMVLALVVVMESASTFRAVTQGVLVVVGLGLAMLLGATGFIRGVRQAMSRFLALDPDSFVHTVALVGVISLTLISLTPLLVLSEPPLLRVVTIMLEEGEDLTDGRGAEGMLLDELYGLIWLVPSAIIAVGYGVRRNLREALQRLGLCRPTWRQLAASVGLTLALVVAVVMLSPAIDWLWDRLGWPQTDMKTFDQLLAHFLSPLGALVIGVVAGLGEELAVRGVLQPRLGIWLSNLFFTALHAFQYNWDGLLVVFLLGIVFGLIRQKTNTTTSAVVHGGYDFVIVMGMVLQIPMFSE